MGLGYRFAWTLAKAGAKVVVTARTKSKLEKLGEAINDFGGLCVVEPLDMRDRSAIRNV